MTKEDRTGQIGYVVLSGGIDSTTCMAIADQECYNVVGISFDYGQRHRKELEGAKAVCEYFEAKHHIIKLPSMPNSMLTDPSQKIPEVSYDELEGVSPTYVPFRNGQLLSIAAAFAHANLKAYNEEISRRARLNGPSSLDYEVFAGVLYFGAHADDAARWAYPDCTPEFIGAMANAIYIGTYREIRLSAPLTYMTKPEIIHHGSMNTMRRAPYGLTWSCYVGGEMHCGVCPTCRSRRDGFQQANVPDPTKYAA